MVMYQNPFRVESAVDHWELYRTRDSSIIKTKMIMSGTDSTVF